MPQNPWEKYQTQESGPWTKYQEPEQIQPGQSLVGSTPSEIASGFMKGAGKGTAQQGLTALQWMQYLAGAKQTPTPMSILPKNEIEGYGATASQVVVPALAAAATGGASLPVQAAVGGLSSGIASASSGASPVSTEIAGTVGAAAPLLQEAAPLVSSLRRGARERVASALGPSGNKERVALDQVLDSMTAKRPIAFSSEGLLAKFEKDAAKATKAFDDILANGPNLANAYQTSAAIDGVIDKLKIGGKFVTPEDAAAADQLMQVQKEIRSLATGPIPGAAKISDLRALKQRYDTLIQGTSKNFNRTLAEASRGDAAKEGFFKIQQSLIQQNPALKEAGKAAQEAITGRNILQSQELRTMTGGLGKVGDVVELGGLTASIMTGRAEPAMAAVTLAALRHILASTPRKLISAAARTSLANAIESGSASKALEVAGQIPAVVERLTQLNGTFEQK